MDYKIPIPPKSQAAYWSHKDRENQNAGLIFERFAPDLAEEAKDQGLKAVLEAFQKSDKRLFSEWNTRWERLVRAGGAEPFTMKTDWRLISGLGKKGSYEIGFTFHTYGFPYLPGSSLKGLARSYGLLEIASLLGEEKLKSLRDHVARKTNQKADELGLLNALDYILSLEEDKEFEANLEVCLPTDDAQKMAVAFRNLFGTTAFAGRVVFYDSIPGHIPSLEMDIMNPHYPKYYDGSEFPTNWQSPIPVKFIAVSSGSAFRFAIGWRNSPEDRAETSEKMKSQWNGWFKGEKIKQTANSESPRMIKLARRWLQGGLVELGAGGKTNAGYGYFKDGN